MGVSLGLIPLGPRAQGQDVEGTDPDVGAEAEYFPRRPTYKPQYSLGFCGPAGVLLCAEASGAGACVGPAFLSGTLGSGNQNSLLRSRPATAGAQRLGRRPLSWKHLPLTPRSFCPPHQGQTVPERPHLYEHGICWKPSEAAAEPTAEWETEACDSEWQWGWELEAESGFSVQLLWALESARYQMVPLCAGLVGPPRPC